MSVRKRTPCHPPRLIPILSFFARPEELAKTAPPAAARTRQNALTPWGALAETSLSRHSEGSIPTVISDYASGLDIILKGGRLAFSLLIEDQYPSRTCSNMDR